MLTGVDITGPQGDTLQLSLTNPNGYLVKEIEGLDPVAASLTSSSMAQVDGAQPQNARRDIRNVTMKLGLRPNYDSSTVQSLRSDLYSYLRPKQYVILSFYLDGNVYAITQGQVESVENSIFTQDPEVNISVLCYDPDLYAPNSQLVSSHTQADNITTVTIPYEGSADAGFIFELNVDRGISSFSIVNITPDNVRRELQIVGSFSPGDLVTINTIPRQKAITLTRSGVTTSVLSSLSSVSQWPVFQTGDNLFAAYTDGLGIPYDVIYTPKFEGI